MPLCVPLLEGLGVVEVGRTTAAAAAGSLLASLGADVVIADRDRPDAGLPRLGGRSGDTSYLWAYLSQGKSTVPAGGEDALIEALHGADVVVCDRAGDLPSALSAADAAGYVDAVGSLNRTAWVTISPFGLTGPYRELRSGDLCDLAAGGALAYTRTSPSARPTKLAGQQGQLLVGEVAAVAALHASDLRLTTDEPVHLDLSAQEAIIATGPFLECARLLWDCGDPELSNFGTPQGAIPCRDGELLLYVIEDRHWDGLLAAMGHPEWAGPYRDKGRRRAEEELVIRRISEWSRELDKSRCAERLQECGVPASPINRPSEAMRSAQFAARGFVETDERAPWNGQLTLGLPATVECDGAPAAAARAPAGLASLKVLDVTHVLGPPLASAWLGAMGAQVVKVEDSARVELYRRFGPFADGVPGTNRSAFFGASNFGKSGVTLDLSTAEGMAELASLIDSADVVFENQSANHARRLGLDEARPRDSLHLCSSGYGRSGPLSGHRAYGQNLMAYSAVTELSRAREGGIVKIGTPWADAVTGVFLAATLAAYGISARRDVRRIDVSMAEVVARHVAEHLLADAAGEPDESDAENDRYPFAPHGAYPCAGDGWIAVSVTDDSAWKALCDVFPDHVALAGPDYAIASERYSRRRELDAVLDETFRGEPASHWFQRLQQAGIRAVPVWSAADLITDPHLLARGYFVEQVHEDAGPRRVAGLPWRPVGDAPVVPSAAPTFGEMKGWTYP